MSVVSRVTKAVKKHLGDLTTKKTDKQKSTEAATKGQRTYREGQRKSGAAGAITGGAAVGAASSAVNEMNKKESKPAETKKTTASKGTGNDTRVNVKDYPTYKKGTPSSKAFKDAFATAKNKGRKTFTFEGRSYKVEDGDKKMMGGGYAMKGKK